MDDRNDQVGWTEAQWNRVREEVLRGWQQVRIAGSFLSAYGPLPPSTQVVPAELFGNDDTIDDQTTAVVLEISLPVRLTRQQVSEEDLSSALSQFRRTAMQVGQLEDWYIFNGCYPPQLADGESSPSQQEAATAASPYRPAVTYIPSEWDFLTGVEEGIAGLSSSQQKEHLFKSNPGALGLIGGAATVSEAGEAQLSLQLPIPEPLNNTGLTDAILNAITELDKRGYVAPHVCVFGRGPFKAANSPVADNTTSLPRDVLEPLIGREILHASAIDIPFAQNPDTDRHPPGKNWQNRGVLLSLAGDPVDIAIVAEATPEFRQVNEKGRYLFSVFERFALRIKDPKAIVALAFRAAG